MSGAAVHLNGVTYELQYAQADSVTLERIRYQLEQPGRTTLQVRVETRDVDLVVDTAQLWAYAVVPAREPGRGGRVVVMR